MQIINYIIDIALISYSVYFLTFVIIGIFDGKKEVAQDPENKFAIIIPAHNEEKVITGLLDNLQELDYPSRLYDIHVIADNCEDNTAALARDHNANVLERFNKNEKGKGYALKYGFEKLGFIEGDNEYDAAVVFDADNLVQDNFLKIMNQRLLEGEKLIQAYIDSKNPADNWVTGTFSMMFWINDRYNLLSRYNVGLSAVLMGTGMCISAETLATVGWKTTTLTEDLEYSIQALFKNIKTTFTIGTKIYDEKPLSFKASCRQRLRWARGQLSVTIKYVPRLLYRGFKEKCLTKLDGGFRLFQMPFIMVYFIVTLLRLAFPDLFYSPLFNFILEKIKLLGFILPIMPYLLPSSVFVLDKLPFKAYKYVILFPVFMYSWILILYYALFTLNKESWLPTTHTRNMTQKDLLNT